MAYSYQSVVPWGRSFAEYREMFALSEADLHVRVLGCADGPAAFNSGMAALGRFAVSCDPLYQFSATQIRDRIRATYDNIINQTYANRDKFVWSGIRSVEELGRIRLAAMDEFMEDYEALRRQGRYVAAELPFLPFPDQTFDLALCSHFLFMYSPILSFEFHERAVAAMCAAAAEVRIFPLLTYDAELSPYLEPLVRTLETSGHHVSLETVAYAFQRGGNQMLRIRSLASA